MLSPSPKHEIECDWWHRAVAYGAIHGKAWRHPAQLVLTTAQVRAEQTVHSPHGGCCDEMPTDWLTHWLAGRLAD